MRRVWPRVAVSMWVLMWGLSVGFGVSAQDAPQPPASEDPNQVEQPKDPSAAQEPEGDQPEGDEEPQAQGDEQVKEGAQKEPEEVELDEDELRALEEALAADAQNDPPPPPTTNAPVGRILQSMNPDMSFILDVAGAWFSAEEPRQTGAHDPNRTGFTLQQLELHVESSVDQVFEMDANIVFSLFGVEVEEAFATTLGLPANLQVRAGQFLTRFGRLNPTHPHSWSFLDQPIVNGKFFGGEGSRGLGGELSWLAPVPWFVEVVGAINNADGACCARSFFGGQDLGVDTPQDLLATVALKQFFELNPSWSLFWGLSMQTGPNPTGQGNRTEIYGTDLFLRYRPLSDPNRSNLNIQAESMLRRRQVPDDVLQDWGLYAQAVYQFALQWEVGARYEQVSGVRQGDTLDPDWISDRRRVSVQATYYPSHFSRWRIQGAYDDADWFDGPDFAIMTALEVLIGAHGAHNY